MGLAIKTSKWIRRLNLKIGIVAGKWDILHPGHYDSIIKTSKLCDFMIIITHKDEIVEKTSEKGFCAIPLWLRCIILRGILLDQKIQGKVIVGIDEDGTVIKTMAMIRKLYPDDELLYTKGGDRYGKNMNSDESKACEALGIKIKYKVGRLLNSSSKIARKINTLNIANSEPFNVASDKELDELSLKLGLIDESK
jgi:cytidyltransferase-like protein